MKNHHFFGAIAFALLLSLNAGVFLESNNWDNTEAIETAFADPDPIPRVVWFAREVTFPCPNPVPNPTFVGCLTSIWPVFCVRTQC